MDCELVRELLGNYIDEDLTIAARREVDCHLAGCKSCAADLETQRAAVQKLTQAGDSVEAPSPWFTERLLHRLAQANDTQLTSVEHPAENLQLGLW